MSREKFTIDKLFLLIYYADMDYKETIISFLKVTGLKKYQLAELANISNPSLTRYLRGERDIRLETWDKINKAIQEYKL